jgi:hypothetical protein
MPPLEKADRIELAEATNEARHRGALERMERQNEFRAQLAEASRDIALRTAKIEGEYAVRLRELELEHSPQEKALDYRYYALRHELMLEEIEEREIVGAVYRIMENLVSHNLKLSQERDRARLETELLELKERHRDNERQHEVLRDRLAIERDALQSQLRNAEFTHAQTVSRIDIPLRMRESGLSEGSNRPSDEEAASWVEALKLRGTL